MTIESSLSHSLQQMRKSLNPYSNGMKIESTAKQRLGIASCLNPYSNGMKIEFFETFKGKTSFCLNPYSNGMKIE